MVTEYKVRHKRTGEDAVALTNGEKITVKYTADCSIEVYHNPKLFYSTFIEVKDGEHCAKIINLKYFLSKKKWGQTG